jgi:hypothetical protein
VERSGCGLQRWMRVIAPGRQRLCTPWLVHSGNTGIKRPLPGDVILCQEAGKQPRNSDVHHDKPINCPLLANCLFAINRFTWRLLYRAPIISTHCLGKTTKTCTCKGKFGGRRVHASISNLAIYQSSQPPQLRLFSLRTLDTHPASNLPAKATRHELFLYFLIPFRTLRKCQYISTVRVSLMLGLLGSRRAAYKGKPHDTNPATVEQALRHITSETNMISVHLSFGPGHHGAHDGGILSGNLRQTGVSA